MRYPGFTRTDLIVTVPLPHVMDMGLRDFDVSAVFTVTDSTTFATQAVSIDVADAPPELL